MNIEAYIISYNEERMIRHTLNHYSKFCSRIVLYDNYSTDHTRELAEQYSPLIEIRSFGTPHLNDREYLKVKNGCWKGSRADYVIVGDMDEFLYHDHLVEMLQQFLKDKVTLPKVQGYNMYTEIFPDNYTIPIFDQVKTGVRAFNFDKQIIFSPKLREINFAPGCHYCEPYGTIIKSSEVLKLLHYKYLGKAYVTGRHAEFARRMSHYNLANRFGAEYMKGAAHIDECFNALREVSEKVI